ncbi:MAG: ABC transporter permease [Candidatus Doudnabacteria bacterium]|nr:ABC transporter permease [Candidatus Doudnabacteria bacterium]
MALSNYHSYKSADEHHSKLYWLVHDLSIFIGRSLKHIFKNTDQLLGLTIQPIMFMLLFRYVFGGAINTGPISYVNFLMAGILVQSVAFGALTTSLSVATDLQRGIIERFKSLPTISWGVLMGHVTADLVRNIIQAIIMISVGLLVGFHPTATLWQWVEITGIVLLFTFAISWVAAIMGLVAKTIEAVQWMGFFLVFPLTFASAAFAPTSSMASGLRIFAQNQPVTHVIEAIRALMIGTPVGNHAWLAVIWCLGIIIVSIPTAGYLFRRYSGR